jgi:predicted nucleotidyltransferase
MKEIKVHKKNKAVIGGKTEYIVIIKQWIHQGFTYLDKTEMFYRIIWELVPFLIFFSTFYAFTESHIYMIVIISFLLGHTLNWIFNFNFWTCLCFTFPSLKNPGNDKTIKYLMKLQKRMLKEDCIGGCMIYGSLSRGVWHIKSDLDMRILRKPGFSNGFKAYLIVFKERIIAVWHKQPLDVFMADSIKFLDKVRDDEFPIFLKNEDQRLVERYKSNDRSDFTKISSLNHILDSNKIK